MKPTSRKRKPQAVKEECTRLHSKLVREMAGSWCEVFGCGRLATDAAHIIGRTFSHTRTDLENAYALCAQHHRLFTNNAGVWMDFVDDTIGRAEYDRLWKKANDGVGVKFDWYDELDRLKAIAEDVL